MLRNTALFQNMDSNWALRYQRITSILRLLFLIAFSLFFATMCTGWLEHVDVWSRAEQLRQNASLFPELPTWFWVFLVPLQRWQYLRYLVAPLGAFVFVFVSNAFYVRDIYHLPSLSRAFHYVFASLFAIFYPIVRVDGGLLDDEDPNDENDLEEKSLLRAIGGPGFVRIQPGNAVAFRDWGRVIGIEHNRLYFMRPFEMIARVVNLEDQHGHLDELSAITRDGIRLHLRSIDYRFSVLLPEKGNKARPPDNKQAGNQPISRDPDTPYPFSGSAIEAIAYSFSVSDRGLETWQEVVSRVVASAVDTYVSNHDLDYLTAPQQDGQNPRRELRVELFAPAVNGALRKAGAKLHWMDIGHFDIDDLKENAEQDPVDQTRTKFWATHWIGDAKTIRSYGEAKHLMYQELARAEAQAEMIMSITDALRDVSFGPDRAETLRQIFLARTAQILETLRDDGTPRKESPS